MAVERQMNKELLRGAERSSPQPTRIVVESSGKLSRAALFIRAETVKQHITGHDKRNTVMAPGALGQIENGSGPTHGS